MQMEFFTDCNETCHLYLEEERYDLVDKYIKLYGKPKPSKSMHMIYPGDISRFKYIMENFPNSTFEIEEWRALVLLNKHKNLVYELASENLYVLVGYNSELVKFENFPIKVIEIKDQATWDDICSSNLKDSYKDSYYRSVVFKYVADSFYI